jgi:23S rRNA pseudouridine1911/1915/1917 synthase
MIRGRTLKVEAAHAGQRFDAFVVRQIATTSRAMVLKAITEGRICVNGRALKKGAKAAEGDVVSIAELMETRDWKAAPNPAIVVPVLGAAPSFLVINKPAGLPVHPLDPVEMDTVVSGLLAVYPELAGIGPDPLFPAVVHRLDAETSGVMLVARTAAAYEAFRRQFRDRQVNKRYIALVCGTVDGGGRLEHSLVHAFKGTHRMTIVEKPERVRDRKMMTAVTEYAVRERLARHTLLDIKILTGVTHQVRCQLAAAGHPIAGDRLYGSPETDSGYAGRLFLHAAEISFLDPESGQPRAFQSDLPGELTAELARLRV